MEYCWVDMGWYWVDLGWYAFVPNVPNAISVSQTSTVFPMSLQIRNFLHGSCHSRKSPLSHFSKFLDKNGTKTKKYQFCHSRKSLYTFFPIFLIKMGSKSHSINFVLQEHQIYPGFHWTKILKTKGRSHTWYCSVEGFLAKKTFWFSWNFIEGSFRVGNDILVLVKVHCHWWQFSG